MAEQDDVWKPGAEGAAGPAAASAEAEPASGLWMNQAFSLDLVVRNGVAVLREWPLPVLASTFLLWLLNAIPGLGHTILQALGVVPVTPVTLSEQMRSLTATLGLLAVYLVLLPLIALLWTGLHRAIGGALRTGSLDAGEILRPMVPALKVAAYAILAYLAILFVTMVVILVPTFGIAFVLAVAGLGEVWIVATAILLTVIGVVVAFWLVLTLWPGALALALDDAPLLQAPGISWRAASGARPTLLVLFLVFGLVQLAIGGTASLLGFLVNPWAAVAASLLVAPILVVIEAVWHGGVTVGWLLYARPESEWRDWAFHRRHPRWYVDP